MTLSPRRGLPFASLTLVVAACSNGATTATPPAAKDAGHDATHACSGGALILPPILNVESAADGSQICGATVQAVSDGGSGTGANLASGCTLQIGGCPAVAPGGGNLSCVLALDGVEGTETVSVSAPGYAPTMVKVSSGSEGCGGTRLASTVMVSLTPSGTGFEAGCGAVAIIPPTVTARDATTGAIICDAVVTVVTDGGSPPDAGSIGFPCASNFGGCPSSPPDGGAISCVLALSFGGSLSAGTQTIEVSAPGYAPKIVTDVQPGIAGCVSMPTPATQVQVSLVPAPVDAGADAGKG